MSSEFLLVVPEANFAPDAHLVVPEIDDLAVDSIFEKPGRNDPCHCTSGKKYKKCHEESDAIAWRFVKQKTVEAHFACAYLRTFPANRPGYDPPPEEIYDAEDEEVYD